MIRQICLSCYKTVELPDDTAGKETPCPNCGKTISVPPKYAAGVAEGGGLASAPPVPPTSTLPPLPPPPTPGPRSGAPPMTDPTVPPGLKSDALPPMPPPPPPAGGLTRGFGVSLNPLWLDWVPAACLLLAFVLTFFPWDSMTLGGHSVMAQTGWDTMFGGKAYNPPLNPPGEVTAKQWDDLDEKLSGSGEDKSVPVRTDWLIVLYLLLLLGLVVLFAAERVVRDPAKFPPLAGQKWLPPIWKWRLAVLGALAVLAFAVLWFQAIQGFGLQQSVRKIAEAKYQPVQKENGRDTQVRSRDIAVAQELGKFPVTQTIWLKLLLVLHAVAVVALAARFWLDLRDNKPHPRLDVRW